MIFSKVYIMKNSNVLPVQKPKTIKIKNIHKLINLSSFDL